MDRVDRSVLGYTRTKASVETALFDLMGKALGLPVYKLLGGLYREEIPVSRIVPIKDPDRMAANALELVDEGYRYLKIKVGLGARKDVDRISAIRKAVGPDVVLILDANQGWRPKEAIDALQRMDEFNVTLIEQPVRSDDHEGLAQVRAAVRPLVEADESAKSLSDIFRLAQEDCVDAVSLKTGKLGGPTGVRKAAGICEASNLHCRIGMSTATRVAAAMDMHLIAAIPNIDFACEVGEFARMESDPTEGLEIVNGKLRVSHEPGLGVQVRVPMTAGTPA
jgi:L-alanine-DL-glutamate epimerase-like enolase superfamily enzyme